MNKNKVLPWLANMFRLWMITTIGVGLAALTSPAIVYESFAVLLGVSFLLSLFNLFLKPLLILFTLPFVFLTLGMGILLINAFLFMLVGQFFTGFTVTSFWAALWSALVISVVSFIFNFLFMKSSNDKRKRGNIPGEYIQFKVHWKKPDKKKRGLRSKKDDDDVIDI